MDRIQAKKQSRKLGRYTVTTIHSIQPSSRQCDNAEKIISGAATSTSTSTSTRGKNAAAASSARKMTSGSIPMFYVKGMVIKRSGTEVHN